MTIQVGKHVLKPYLAGPQTDSRKIEKSRAIFARMIEAGAQNKASLRAVLIAGEFRQLRDRVLGAIQALDATGAVDRVQALKDMPPLSAWVAAAGQPPLNGAPVLILFAENEKAVLDPRSPTWVMFDSMLPAFFPRGERRVVRGGAGSTVQHASLIFIIFSFNRILPDSIAS